MLEIALERLCIPFRTAFRHASATRTETQSLWVEARAEDGTVGYGESCPREYVTGESLQSAAEFFRKHRASIATDIRDLASLKSWVRSRAAEIDRHPAAWCAIEIALLDLFAKQASQTVEEYLSLPKLEGTFRYTAVLGDSELPVFQQQLARYHAMGFSDYKVKISGDLARDQGKLEAILAAGVTPNHIRLDANNLWKQVEGAIEHLRQLGPSFHAVEEPLNVGNYAGMAEIAQALKYKIIVDESFSRTEQFDELRERSQPWVVNLRVSKMGGVLRSLEIVDRARELGIPVIIGAQVGETSVLTRAAMTVAHRARGVMIGQEGAFGTLLLSADVCRPPLMFGNRGELQIDARLTASSGFGLQCIVPQSFRNSLS